jgi:putative flippase GtrA
VTADASAPLASRLLSRRAAAMLGRNTVVSCGVFALGLVLLWLLVEVAGVDKLPAAALSFVVSNALHYAIGRRWIFPGTARGPAAGFAYFLVNAGIGLAITMALFAAFIRYTPINYLAARIIVSLVAGLVVFVLNAVLNFQRL